MPALRRAVFLVALACASLAVAFATGCSGCGDKSSKASTTAAIQARSDAGDGEPHAGADAGIDDSAMPAMTGDELQNRMRHLLEAVSQNNADLAGDALFPRDAYLVVKDAPDPAKLWEKRVSNAFHRSVERTHKHMKGVDQAKFLSFELGHSIVQIVPRRRDFKKPLWRVKHSKLLFTIEGKPRQLDIAEMTAWRGAWYVTRLR